MATENLEYLDESGLNRTAGNVLAKIAELKAQIEEELIALNGVYPDITAGTLVGADETSQWAQRTSACNGGVIVRSVQGATDVQSEVLVPVNIAGIASADVNGNALDSIEWQSQTLRAAGSIADTLTADALVTRIGVVDLGTLTWTYDTAGSVPFFRSKLPTDYAAPTASGIDNLECGKYEARASTTKNYFNSHAEDKTIRPIYGQSYNVGVQDSAYTDAAAFKTAMDGVILFYELATPITTTISPALPMTYKVQAGGSESIIVPDDEVSAAPIITTANPADIGSIITDGAVTTPKIANGAVTGQKIASRTISESNITLGALVEQDFDATFLSSLVKSNDLSNLLSQEGCAYFHPYFKAASVAAAQVLALMGITTVKLLPNEISLDTPILQDVRFRLVWLNGTELDSGNVFYSADTNGGVITLFATGRTSKCSGVMGVDTSWTVTSI